MVRIGTICKFRSLNARDWEIIECLAHGEIDADDFDLADIERVRRMVMITDEQYEQLVADGHIDPENLAEERSQNQTETDQIFKAATTTTYQLSTGQKRSVIVDDREKLYDAFYDLVEFDGDVWAEQMIRVEAAGSDRIIFINRSALDYVIVPTHQFYTGRIDANDVALDAL